MCIQELHKLNKKRFLRKSVRISARLYHNTMTGYCVWSTVTHDLHRSHMRSYNSKLAYSSHSPGILIKEFYYGSSLIHTIAPLKEKNVNCFCLDQLCHRQVLF